jgi:sulfite reductase (ferredoxin)
MACPALPTCGLALSEAERAAPGVVDTLQKELAATGLRGLPLRLNMTGCPNGCARPYTAEIGIVGRTKKGYDVYVGGSVAGTRLADRLAVDVKLDQLGDTLRPVFERYRDEANPGEGFGDFCDRLGVAAMTKVEI